MKALHYSDDPLYTNFVVRDEAGKLVAIVDGELIARRLCFADRVCEALFAMLRCCGGGYEDKARAIRELTKIGYFEDERAAAHKIELSDREKQLQKMLGEK